MRMRVDASDFRLLSRGAASCSPSGCGSVVTRLGPDDRRRTSYVDRREDDRSSTDASAPGARGPVGRGATRRRPATFPTTRCSSSSPTRLRVTAMSYPEGWTITGRRPQRHDPRQEQPRSRRRRARAGADASRAVRPRCPRCGSSNPTLDVPPPHAVILVGPASIKAVYTTAERAEPGHRQERAADRRPLRARARGSRRDGRPRARRRASTTSTPTG